jgi:hypothetical protein
MASIPDFVFDTYKTYKYDSTLFLSWLGETAAKCNLFPAARPRQELNQYIDHDKMRQVLDRVIVTAGPSKRKKTRSEVMKEANIDC